MLMIYYYYLHNVTITVTYHENQSLYNTNIVDIIFITHFKLRVVI